MAAPPPLLIADLSGQPILISIPANPNSFMCFAKWLIDLVSVPHNWAIRLVSSEVLISRPPVALSPARYQAVALVNSEKKISGLAAFLMT